MQNNTSLQLNYVVSSSLPGRAVSEQEARQRRAAGPHELIQHTRGDTESEIQVRQESGPPHVPAELTSPCPERDSTTFPSKFDLKDGE